MTIFRESAIGKRETANVKVPILVTRLSTCQLLINVLHRGLYQLYHLYQHFNY
jgi:hypothetical protein